jgi:alpha-beta hydrolase superfamily lysophospholipase
MSATNTSARSWSPDPALDGFEATTLDLAPDYEGPVVATLVRRPAPQRSGRAVLYLHGFIDYFFQAHLADAYNAHGYDFYALDLRKYGRSLRPHQTPNFCRDLREYYAEIDAAIELIAGEPGHTSLLVNGHSTGGLIAALYAHEGARRAQIDALFLNSPFVDLNATPGQRRLSRLVYRVGRMAPKLPLGPMISRFYAQSIHQNHGGDWSFNTDWKPIAGFPAYAGWVRAIMVGQHRLHEGLQVSCPTLLMHAAISTHARSLHDDIRRADAVLDVEHMRRYGPGIGKGVTMLAVEGGMHDLMLSAAPVRERVFAELFAWLERQGL